MELEEVVDKVQKFVKTEQDMVAVINDMRGAIDSGKKLFDDLKSVDDLVSAKNRGPADFEGMLQENCKKALDWLCEHVSQVNQFKTWLVGDQEKIKASSDHWKTDLPKKLDSNIWPSDDAVKAVQDAWQGKTANAVCLVLKAEGIVIKQLDKLCEAVGKVIGFLGQLLDKLRELIYGIITKIISMIVEKLGDALLGSFAGITKAVWDLLWEGYDLVKTCLDLWNKAEDIEKQFETCCNSIKAAFQHGQILIDDIKQLTA
ncbi:Mlp family lipoprotein [Segniliparus rugosus]|uniref:Uncharacterized protein n=1 Tax=Segniliparus rugosus (strain ATCC BAA-974 / DSM 45345 / CCUG 50838 / CIP 108380 / JCM 13579 / CDC 945) TaxID=679197 RepID=E5XV17_SEGRC|nr:Mlp family lipoprotein [Segniliparus rugosus]EFV11853.1 hypothetical protein HMPREF9336_03339 [Segniliparus rugosus ATCC BAA-974]